jgi:uncharacterized transporter YbjL|eukprot:COSAG06_NODE_9205_length_1959_cov_2.007527_3_plen_123_part_00
MMAAAAAALTLLLPAAAAAAAAGSASTQHHHVGTIAGVMSGTHTEAAAVGSKLSYLEDAIQRQTYAFPSEYEAIDCGLTLRFSSGTVFGPVSVRLRRDEPTTTTRCALCVLRRCYHRRFVCA